MNISQITYYRFKLLAASPLTLVIMFLFPAAAVFLSGLTITSESHVIPIALVDQDKTPYSELVIERIKERPTLKIMLMGEDDAVRQVKSKKNEAAYVIEKGFMEQIQQGKPSQIIRIIKSPASLSAEMVGEYLAGEVMRLNTNETAAEIVVREYEKMGLADSHAVENLKKEALEYTDAQWRPEPLMPMEYREYLGEKPREKESQINSILFPYGLLASLILFNAFLAVGWIIEERFNGIIPRVKSTTTGLRFYFAGNYLFIFIIGLLTLLFSMLLLRLGLGIRLNISLMTMILLISYLICISGMTMLFGVFLKTPFQLQVTAPLFTLTTGLLGGSFGNLSEVSGSFRMLSFITPQGWLLHGLGSAIFQPAPNTILLHVILLLAAGFVFFLTARSLLIH